jgi:cobalt-zinc-cadmium efflux system outer membrane protein
MRLAQQCLFLCALRVSAGVLTLEQAEEVLVQQNLQVLAGRVTADVAEAAQRVAGLRPNPTLQLGAEQFPVWSNIHGSYPRFVSTNGDAGANPTYTGQLSHLIERGRKRELRAEQAGAVTEAAKAQTLDTIRQQLLQLRQAYTAALLAKANLELAQQTDLQYRETERLNEIRLRAGDIAEVDLDRIKAARLSYVQAIEEANLAYAQAIRDVQTLLTAEPQSDLTVAGELLVRPVPLSLA